MNNYSITVLDDIMYTFVYFQNYSLLFSYLLKLPQLIEFKIYFNCQRFNYLNNERINQYMTCFSTYHISLRCTLMSASFLCFFSPPSLNGQKISCIQTNSTKFEVTGSKLIIKIFSAEIESRFARSHCILQPLLPCLLSSNSDYHVSTQVKTNRTRTMRRNRIADFIGEKKNLVLLLSLFTWASF